MIIACTIVIFGQGYHTFLAPIVPADIISSYIGLFLAVTLYVVHKVWKRPAIVKNIDMDFETGAFQDTVIDIRQEDELNKNGNPISKWKRVWKSCWYTLLKQ